MKKFAKEEMQFEQEYKEAISKLAAFQPTWEEKIANMYLNFYNMSYKIFMKHN